MKALVFLSALLAQTTAPVFEVASVKPSATLTTGSSVHSETGRLIVRNATLRRCMRGAYGVPEVRIVGIPKALEDAQFDIDARAEGPAGDSELMAMLQSLLADRFKLVFHRETRPLSGYALTVAKGGFKANPSEPGAPSHGNSSRNHVDGKSYTLAQLAIKLSEALKEPVADLTGIEGEFDFTLDWVPDDPRNKEIPSGPSIFTAIQEQLGLRLESRRIPSEVLVVDSAQAPSAN